MATLTKRNCQTIRASLDGLDLSSSHQTRTLFSIRQLVLSHLEELEATLFRLHSPVDIDSLKSSTEDAVEDARAWANDALDILQRIRSDVRSHLPDLDLDFSLENLVNHLPDVNDVRSHLPDINISDQVREKIDLLRSHLPDLPFQAPLDYIPVLIEHLGSLHAHLSSPNVDSTDSSVTPLFVLNEMLDKIVTSELYTNLVSSEKAIEDTFEKATHDVKIAIQRSLNGSKLIQYVDLPDGWRSNPFVHRGYRFIPIDKWPLIILSLFALHNETLNIHTHLIPGLFWLRDHLPRISTSPEDLPSLIFTSSALLCLFASTVWHTMSGCAHYTGMVICARMDYVGIGWLISASVGTVVHYGFYCHETPRIVFLSLCLISALLGTVFPFMEWFDKFEYRLYRVAFFLGMAFSAVAPLAWMARLYGFWEMVAFINPVFPSIISYLVGLVFYATHFPECLFAAQTRASADHSVWFWIDRLGGGSHAIWHGFIVLAISQHRAALDSLEEGIGGVLKAGGCSIPN